ncbi:type IV secretion system DNA-binding domain-containing protein [Acetobacter fabarum]|uniref:type IV secretion system DNA-binding domain-containing protein n=2 Tax=Acetobacter fabarum TaxID=483199 RepID=UPI0014055DE6|nr:type IV secretion system DNA-binding domain-containing protein [Acetobacter fabarum]NHO42879.1 type IV secretion system DNA-binding domain-containing protein [Acetobacter fabarum]
MGQLRRRIDGPQDHHEQRDGVAYRDTRTLGTRILGGLRTGLSAAPFIGFAGLAVTCPALTTLLVPPALAYTAFVLTRPTIMPLRLPASSKRKDFGNPVPDPKRVGVDKPDKARGDWLLGWDEVSGQQIWVSGSDMTMHGVLPGATGSGKTQFIYSLLASAMAQGTGFTIVDGKGSNNLVFSLQALQEHWGAAANMRVINFLVSSGDRKTHTWNPFSSVNPEGMAELLRTLFLPDKTQGGGNSEYFASRASSLIGAMSNVFVWMRDHEGIPITASTMRANFSDIQALIDLTRGQDDTNASRRFRYFSARTQKVERIPLPDDFPEEMLHDIRFYVQETGGYSQKAGDADGQEKVRQQHGFVIGGFAKTFMMMTTTYGHIFNCDVPDVELTDVIFNRRNLIVLLPSLENDPETNAAIGKTFITAQRYALAAALGASIEGNYTDLVENRPSSASTPYLMLYDESNYFATRGIDVMMAQGRELNVSIWMSFQEVGSLYATLGRDWSVPLLGNPKLKIFEQVEDAGPTREWIEQAGGTMQVGVLSGYENTEIVGDYTTQTRADIREVKRISWNDIQALRQGQAIIMFRGKRLYTRLFYAGIKPQGANRLYAPLSIARSDKALPASRTLPNPEDQAVVDALIKGADLVNPEKLPALPGPLGEIYNRMAVVLQHPDCTQDINLLFNDPLPPDAYVPFRALFRDMPEPFTRPASGSGGLINPNIDRKLFETMVRFEMRAGATEADARKSIASALNQAAV